MEQNEVLTKILEIVDLLQSKKWADHDEQTLIAAQGKLATYQSNLAYMVAHGLEKYELMEIRAKQMEDQGYLTYREGDHTDGECKAMARSAARTYYEETAGARRQYNELRGLLNACESIITAVQVHLRNTHREAFNSRYQPNAN